MELSKAQVENLLEILNYIIANEYTHWEESEGFREGHIYEKAIDLYNSYNDTLTEVNKDNIA